MVDRKPKKATSTDGGKSRWSTSEVEQQYHQQALLLGILQGTGDCRPPAPLPKQEQPQQDTGHKELEQQKQQQQQQQPPPPPPSKQQHEQEQEPMLQLTPVNNANIYARRHSAHTCHTMDRETTPPVPPPVPSRPSAYAAVAPPTPPPPPPPPAIKKRQLPPLTPPPPSLQPPPKTAPKNRALPPIPSTHAVDQVLQKNRTLPQRVPPPSTAIPSPSVPPPTAPRLTPPCRTLTKPTASVFEFGPSAVQDIGSHGRSCLTKPYYKAPASPAAQKVTSTTSAGKVSIRQDSSVSSDSFSQTSSPSYTTKTMETPLLPSARSTSSSYHHHHAVRVNGILNKVTAHHRVGEEEAAAAAAAIAVAADVAAATQDTSATITKSASTPASLQTIVRFHNGSNMSLHHRIIRDIRRPSSHCIRRVKLKFRLAQMIFNAVALVAIGGGMAAYFKAYPLEMNVINNTATGSGAQMKFQKTPILVIDKSMHMSSSPSSQLIPLPSPPTSVIGSGNGNPAPGICLQVIVNYCLQHRIPYNFTVFPNYMGNFGQREAQQDLENMYNAVVDVRCYELAALFLCTIFVPKCGRDGDIVRPCRSLCNETTRRCGFFLDVFGLTLPSYMECDLFPDSTDPDECVGHQEVQEAKVRSQIIVCPSGFQCDVKRCIPKDWQCDGHVDCQDQTDELNCEKCGANMIHCGADKCITQEHMCDGTVHCPWAQDERNCLRLSEQNGDEGRGQLELFRPDQQQWMPACVVHWNPETSPASICSLLGYSSVNVSRLLKGTDLNVSPPIQEATKWRMRQHTRNVNMLRDFRSCKGNTYSTVDIVCNNYMCGKTRKTYAEQKQLRIVGGVAAKPGDWPFLAALLGGPEEIFYCAGVLIADQWVLTASHCVGNHSNVSGWTIQLGITRRHAHSYYGQKMRVKRVVPHPHYNMGITHDNDIALFQLSSRVTFHEHLLPVCLPAANKVLKPGTKCTVIGWGKKEDTGVSEYEPEINEVEVPVLNRDLCNTWLESRDLNVTDGMICAGYKEGGKDACQGDSGGPLLCKDEQDPDRWFVGGIVSWGIKCAHPHLPGVYAYVPKYIPWILQQMQLYGGD